MAAELVDHHRRQVAGMPHRLEHQVGDAGFALQHVVERRVVGARSAGHVAGREGIDDARVAGGDAFVGDAQSPGRRRPHAVDEHVGRGDQVEQGFAALRAASGRA